MLASAPSAATPNIYVFSSGTSARLPWPLDASTPASSAYSYSVAGFGPFETLDEALSERGIAARIPSEIRASYSDARSVVVHFP
jgi:hypothetical protein